MLHIQLYLSSAISMTELVSCPTELLNHVSDATHTLVFILTIRQSSSIIKWSLPHLPFTTQHQPLPFPLAVCFCTSLPPIKTVCVKISNKLWIYDHMNDMFKAILHYLRPIEIPSSFG